MLFNNNKVNNFTSFRMGGDFEGKVQVTYKSINLTQFFRIAPRVFMHCVQTMFSIIWTDQSMAIWIST